MELKDILTLIQAVSDSKLTEFDLSFEDEKKSPVTIHAAKAEKEVIVQTAAPMAGGPAVEFMAATVAAAPAAESSAKEEDGDWITSPMVGTFYSAPSEGADPFIQVGDTVKKGQVIGIVEAMKLMNEIVSTYDGVVTEIAVKNADMVGFEQNLVKISGR